MHQILKSLLPTEQHQNAFQRLCNRQIEEMRVWKKQMMNVAKDPKKFHPYPSPVAHPDIMASIVPVGNDFNIEFEIIDDTPKPSLSEKKSMIARQVMDEASKRQEKILPARKSPLIAIKIAELSSLPEEERTPDQKVFLGQHAAKARVISAIHLHCATLLSGIEDLTEDNIDAWKPMDFPEIKV